MGTSASKTGRRAATRKARQAQALALRQRGYTLRRIAREMRISVGTAHNYVSQALAAIDGEIDERARDVRRMELDRLDDAVSHVYEVFDDPEASHGDRMAAIDRLVRVSKRRSELQGLDAPQQIEQTTHNTTAQYNLDALNKDELRAWLALVQKAKKGET